MPGPRYVVQAVPIGEFRVWDIKAQEVAYLPRTLSEERRFSRPGLKHNYHAIRG
jgi:hypothetical protein